MKKTLYVAEIGINHNGDLPIAMRLIDLAKKHGFDYVKFQKRDIESCYTSEYLDSERHSPWGNTQRDQKKGLEFSIADYSHIDAYCREVGIRWFYSPWDIKSAEQMQQFDCDFIKIAKASTTHSDLVEYCDKLDMPLIVSINPYEYDPTLLYRLDNLSYILSCISLYPSPDDYTGVECIKFLEGKFPAHIGFSNHSPNWVYPVIASYLGAKMIEVHITLDKEMYGSDQKASLNDSDLSQMMHFVKKPFNGLRLHEILDEESKVLSKLRQTW